MSVGEESRWAERYRSLYEVARVLGSALTLPAVLNIAARMITEAMNAKACMVRLLDEKNHTVTLAAVYGLREDYLKTEPVEVEESLIDRESLEKKMFAVYDVAKDDRWQDPEIAEKEDIHSVLCVPLSIRDRMLGNICIYTSTPREFDEEETQFLSALANLSAVAIEHTRLHAECRKRYEDMVTLFDVAKTVSSSLEPKEVLHAVVKSTVEAMGVKASSIRLLDEKREHLRLAAAYGLSEEYLDKGPVPLEKSFIDKEALEGRSSLILDVTSDERWKDPEAAEREGIASVLCVPLTADDKVFGTLRAYTAEPREFDKEDMQFLQALASQATIAIKNSKLYRIALENWQHLVGELWEKLDVWGVKEPE